MEKLKFYRCEICGNLFTVLKGGGVTPDCCGKPMILLEPNSTDAAGEKHVPAIARGKGSVTVKVGEVPHPMLEEHWIQWVAVVQKGRVQYQWLHPGETPEATFAVVDDLPLAAYEFCNIHGLWVAED